MNSRRPGRLVPGLDLNRSESKRAPCLADLASTLVRTTDVIDRHGQDDH